MKSAHATPATKLLILLLLFGLAARAQADPAIGFNCGDNRNITTEDGSVYQKDRDYSLGNGSGRIGGRSNRPGLLDDNSDLGGILPGVQTNRLIASRAVDWQEYRFDVPSGTYLVSMHFAENLHWRGLRTFSIVAEGDTLLSRLDIFDEVDRRYALSKRRLVDVFDGQLNVMAVPGIDEPVIQGIHIEKLDPDSDPPAVPTGLQLLPGYLDISLFWDSAYERDQLGVEVWRTDLTAGGEEALITDEPVLTVRFTDRDLDPDHTYRYRLTAVDAWGNRSPPSSALEASPLSPTDTPLTYHAFWMAEEELVDLFTRRASNDYRPATYVFETGVWDDAGIRLRGNTTRSLTKKNYKARFEPDNPLPDGHTKLNLQSEGAMRSPMREKIGFDVFPMAGAMASTVDYVHLSRNDRFIGVYVEIEQVDENLLQDRALQGTIFRASSDAFAGNFTKKSRLRNYYSTYTLKKGDYRDYAYLDAFIRAVIESPDDEFVTAITEHLDIESFLRWYSTQAIISGIDQVLHNYFLYRNNENGLFYFLPWDVQDGWDSVGMRIDYGTEEHRYFIFFWNRLYDRLMNSPPYRRMYAVQLERLVDELMASGEISNRIDADHAFLTPEVHRDFFKRGWEDMSDFDRELDDMLDFVERREANIRGQLETFAPDPSVNLFLNEVARWNVNGPRDEWGEAEPWLEIHNFGNETVDLAGLVLGALPESSDPAASKGPRWLSNAPLWSFPGGHSIEAGEHLLVWLDGEPGEGPLHTSFRVDANTLWIALLSAPWNRVVDLLELRSPALSDVSDARIPDAGASILPVSPPSPRTSNGTSTPIVRVTLDAVADRFAGDPLPLTATVRNDAPVAISAELSLSARIRDQELSLPIIPIVVDAGQELDQPVSVPIPVDLPPGTATLDAELTLLSGAVLDHDRISVSIWDPRPVSIVINEIMADNDTTILDDEDQAEDWIELLNVGDDTVELHGLYLSDDPADPTKWGFADVSIEAGGHLIVWCDDDPEQSPTHTTFKLSRSGEEVGLYDIDLRSNAPIDHVAFPPLGDDIAYGRSPDGSPNLAILPYATPGAPNP